ncbi:hypothetical protein Pelo_8136 [Pelomyxa schiedti]|nr:hypothetical protein Pelo_12192 [Pelomyxa schiedti]KAH3760060.1 hypothetical protein Pelo_8136 [Pelomyxa schiedti]
MAHTALLASLPRPPPRLVSAAAATPTIPSASASASVSFVIHCPQCNGGAKLTVDDISSSRCVEEAVVAVLKTDSSLLQESEALRAPQLEAESPLCAAECGKKATFLCVQCNNAPLCEECFPGLHKFQFQKGHTKKSIGEMAAIRDAERVLNTSNCREHFQPLTIFCTQCDTLSCVVCGQFGKHRDHSAKCVPVVEMKEKLMAKLTTVLDQCTALQKRMNASEQEISLKCTTLAQNSGEVEKCINAFFDSLLEDIQRRRNQLLTQLNLLHSISSENLEIQRLSTKTAREFLQALAQQKPQAGETSPKNSSPPSPGSALPTSADAVVVLQTEERIQVLQNILKRLSAESLDLSPCCSPVWKWEVDDSLLKSLQNMCITTNIPVSKGTTVQTVVTQSTPAFSITFTTLNGHNQVPPTTVDYTSPYQKSVILSGGIQKWVVPSSGKYKITAVGPSGGNSAYFHTTGGLGAAAVSVVELNEGTIVNILVGQEGEGDKSTGGGGGGTFIWEANGDEGPLVCAGGGGGAVQTAGKDASVTPDGTHGNGLTSGGGVNGGGGTPSDPRQRAGGGAGWLSDGCQGEGYTIKAGGGVSPLRGGGGGTFGGTQERVGSGGFGGGGGGQGQGVALGGGGGGGYSGGGPGAPNGSLFLGGGGGGSFCSTKCQQTHMTVSQSRGNGSVTIENLA